MAITGHGPRSPVGGTHYHRQRESPSHYFIHHGSETPLTYPVAFHPCTHGASQYIRIKFWTLSVRRKASKNAYVLQQYVTVRTRAVTDSRIYG
ncbi:hypothetical protein AVEN_176204-1 [Araneus ventricosus]|uniref:Uncharacterized protein n=1 Tax=Araneus ventricosus TaxID=182803 RepID=A0A4Y2FD52_ARAVE|nr:hypothetical protein AVEN_176204-1 [Araneus ventricosus]